MNKIPRNYSGIFNLFSRDNPIKNSSLLTSVGKASFSASFILSSLLLIFNRDKTGNAFSTKLTFGLIGLGYLIGLLMFISVGMLYNGRLHNKQSFTGAAGATLLRSFIFVFLPAILITAIVVIWAIVSKQTGFQ